MLKNKLFSLLILLLVAGSFLGCSTLQYDQGSTPSEQFEKDKAYCEMEANKAVADNADPYGEIYASVYDPCMRSKGYSRSKN